MDCVNNLSFSEFLLFPFVLRKTFQFHLNFKLKILCKSNFHLGWLLLSYSLKLKTIKILFDFYVFCPKEAESIDQKKVS
jgi:hypothetical protein